MGFKDIPFGSTEKFNVVIETPAGSAATYKYDEDSDVMKPGWTYTDGFSSPFDYGYVSQTRGGDGAALDAIVLGEVSLSSGSVVECRAIGMIEVVDRGEEDNKILALPTADEKARQYEKLEDLPFDYKRVFKEFFEGLGKQKNKIMEVKGFRGKTAAMEELESAHMKFHQ